MRQLRLAILSAILGGCGSSHALDQAPAPVCTAPGYHVESDAITIERVQAAVVDPGGASVPGLPVQVCGLNQCFNGTSTPTGQVSVSPKAALELPAFKYGDGFDYAEFAVLLGSDARQDLGQVLALPLPAFTAGAKFPASGTVTSGDLSLSIERGSSTEHDHLTYSDDTELVFRSAQLPLADSPNSPDPSLGFELVYGVAPLGTTFCPPAMLSLQNRAQWQAGRKVDVYVQGLDVAEKWAPYGSWLKVAEARVASDGTRIETTSGGIPILSSIALRPQ